jgi:hypothetical protein
MLENRLVKLQQARGIVELVVSEPPGPVSVFVDDDHGELVAAATMDGAAPARSACPRSGPVEGFGGTGRFPRRTTVR